MGVLFFWLVYLGLVLFSLVLIVEQQPFEKKYDMKSGGKDVF